MSFGNNYNGGRTRMGTKVFLNVYDLSPANEYLYPVGLGFHHSGVEVLGVEYSYGSGGSGIFEGPPKQAGGPGAKFRIQMEMGTFDGGSQELNKALDDLRHTDLFGPANYNLVKRNCNHFCNALVWRLLRRTIPAYINRWADIGNCCSCLLPKQLLEESPVGGESPGRITSGNSSPSPFSMSRGTSTGSNMAFMGKGQSLGGSTAGTSSSCVSSESSSLSSPVGFLSKWTKSSHTGQTVDDLTDRREKARKAALARLERSQQQQQQLQQQTHAEKES